MYTTLLQPLWDITTTPSTLNPLKALDLSKFINDNKVNSIFDLNKYSTNPNRTGISFKDKPECYIAILNVAGFEKSEIKISEEKLSYGSSKIQVTCVNADLEKLKYEFYIPENSDTSSIKSTLKNGLLTITTQIKKPKIKTMTIEIE